MKHNFSLWDAQSSSLYPQEREALLEMGSVQGTALVQHVRQWYFLCNKQKSKNLSLFGTGLCIPIVLKKSFSCTSPSRSNVSLLEFCAASMASWSVTTFFLNKWSQLILTLVQFSLPRDYIEFWDQSLSWWYIYVWTCSLHIYLSGGHHGCGGGRNE